jgi:hypothetical protein
LQRRRHFRHRHFRHREERRPRDLRHLTQQRLRLELVCRQKGTVTGRRSTPLRTDP